MGRRRLVESWVLEMQGHLMGAGSTYFRKSVVGRVRIIF